MNPRLEMGQRVHSRLDEMEAVFCSEYKYWQQVFRQIWLLCWVGGTVARKNVLCPQGCQILIAETSQKQKTIAESYSMVIATGEKNEGMEGAL